MRVSPLLTTLLTAALEAAARTDGDVNPTVGAAMCGLGYDRDFAEITPTAVVEAAVSATPPAEPRHPPGPHRSGRPGRQLHGGPAHARQQADRRVRFYTSPHWRSVRLDGRDLTVPSGVLLDLGATAKAVAADRTAALVASRLDVGVLVALGGDIATAGPAPSRGWRVLVRDRPGDPQCTVELPAGAALATSSTVSRTWGERLHHILDPRTGRPATRVWRTVSVAAHSCLDANTLSTAAIVRGHGAVRLLAGSPSRLVTSRGEVLRLGGWPS
jgi:thiamine biosynthesis lipoprotein